MGIYRFRRDKGSSTPPEPVRPPLDLRGLSRTPGRQARATELDLSLLPAGGRAAALVVAVQDQHLPIPIGVAKHPENDFLGDLIVHLDRAIDAELEQTLTQLTTPRSLPHDLDAMTLKHFI